MDAFVQRCRDLIEVCRCQMHFSRWEDGNKTIVPIFFGQHGPEITRSLLEIEATFDKNLRILTNVEKAILDVKNTSWHEEFSKFRTAVKELEVMVQNLISSAFETVRSVEEGVMLLDVFGHFGAREAIKRTIDKKTVEVFYILGDQLNAVKRELSSKKVRSKKSTFLRNLWIYSFICNFRITFTKITHDLLGRHFGLAFCVDVLIARIVY